MSANLAYVQPARRPREERQPATHIEIVASPAHRRARPKLAYGLGATAVLFAIFLTQLLITIALSSGAYTVKGLQATQQDLGRTASALNEHLDTLGSSQNLQANAVALGMVSSSQAAFLRLSDGAVLGTALPAGATGVGTVAADGSTDPLPNSLLAGLSLIKSTGPGHGDANAADSAGSNSESSQGQGSPASAGGTSPVSSSSSNSGDIPSPVTH